MENGMSDLELFAVAISVQAEVLGMKSANDFDLQHNGTIQYHEDAFAQCAAPLNDELAKRVLI